MEIIGPLLLSFIAGMSTLFGCIFIFFKINKKEEFITFCLAFSFIIMLSISLFDLLPDSISVIYHYKGVLGLFLALLVFILGNTTIRLINSKIMTKNSNKLYRVGILSMLSLIIHNFPEGIAVFMSSYTNFNIGLKLCIAIMLHNIPEGIIIGVPLYLSGVSKKRVVGYTFLSGIAEPIGALLCFIILKNYINEVLLSFILVYVSGIMINLSINEVLKEAINYNKKPYITYGILIGSIFYILTLLI